MKKAPEIPTAYLDLGTGGGKSSTVTTRHLTASQNWIENKPKTLLQRISEKCDTKLLTERERTYLFHF